MSDAMKLDAAAETNRIGSFIQDELRHSGRSRIVMGLSGGVDSAVVALLCARAAGPRNVLGLLIPYETSSPESAEHARAVAEVAGIPTQTVDITAPVHAMEERLAPMDRLRHGNLLARMRMIVLYDCSAAHDGIVSGTGNRTEWMLGYTTLHGDSACGFAPILHLYKCQVRQLAKHLGVPAEIIAKPPSADLWRGQTDEEELGFTYEEADALLFHLLDRGRSESELEAMGFSAGLIQRVNARVAGSAFKRRMPHSLSGWQSPSDT